MNMDGQKQTYEQFKADILQWKDAHREEYRRFAKMMADGNEMQYLAVCRAIFKQLPGIRREWQQSWCDDSTDGFRRRKTGQQLTVKWEKCMEDIIAKYGENTATRYLLPIITNPCSDERTQYRNAICRINVALKEVAGLAGLNIPLTMHVARHCWASVAKSKNIPLSVISEGMGHDSEETTRIYLASLDTSVVDKANSLILKDF